jgi:hypothetical protein
MGVSHLYIYEMNYIRMSESYFWTTEIQSPIQEHLVCTSKVK